MKKMIAIVFALLMLVSFAACSSKTKTYDKVTENNMEFEAETMPEITGEEYKAEKNEIEIELDSIEDEKGSLVTGETYENVTGAKIEFSVADPIEFDIDIETYDESDYPEINFEISDFESDMKDNVEADDADAIGNISDDKKVEINNTKASLLEDLVIAFKDAGLNVSVNKKSGMVSLDSSVLFGSDSSELSGEGKAFLKKFINTYTEVVYSEKYEDFISKIIIEGHTAPVTGITYEESLPFSEERANVVKDYCISADAGVSEENLEELSDDLEAKGLSNSRPVTDADGNVNMDASRRVTFRFLIDMD